MTHPQTIQQQLEEVWALVDELGDLSVRLRRAADAAEHSFKEEEEPNEHE